MLNDLDTTKQLVETESHNLWRPRANLQYTPEPLYKSFFIHDF